MFRRFIRACSSNENEQLSDQPRNIENKISTCKKLSYNQTWAVSKDGLVKCEPLTKKSLNGALKVIREGFIKNEPLCKAVGILEDPGADEEFLKACYDAAKDGVSFVAIDTSVSEVVGVMFNKIQVVAPKGETYYEKLRRNCKHKSVKAFYDFTIEIESKEDLFKRYNTNCLMEIMFMATLPDFKQNNVAGLMVATTHKLGRFLYSGVNAKTPIDEEKDITNADAMPSIVTAMATSAFSQKIGVKLGYEKVLEVSYDDYTIDGKRFSECIGDVHKACWVVVKRLDI